VNGLEVVEPSAAALADAVLADEYTRLLGMPRARPLEGDLAQRAQAARAWYAAHGRPWFAARRAGIARLDAESVALASGPVFTSRALAERLRSGEAHGLVALAVTAGPEVDQESRRLWQEEKPDEAYFLDRFGAVVAEHLVRWASLWVCRESEVGGETVLAHLSPGCGGWDFEEQARLMQVIVGGEDQALGPLRMLASGMLAPKNSLLAVRGLTRRRVAPSAADACHACDLAPCTFRRAPYRGAA
jgi:hypothetical protein